MPSGISNSRRALAHRVARASGVEAGSDGVDADTAAVNRVDADVLGAQS